MFKFNVKPQPATLSFIEAESPMPSIYGTPQMQLQALLTFDNGRSWVLPLPLLLQLVEPSDADAEMFLDGLRTRFNPKPEPIAAQFPESIDFNPKDNGGFQIKMREPPNR